MKDVFNHSKCVNRLLIEHYQEGEFSYIGTVFVILSCDHVLVVSYKNNPTYDTFLNFSRSLSLWEEIKGV